MQQSVIHVYKSIYSVLINIHYLSSYKQNQLYIKYIKRAIIIYLFNVNIYYFSLYIYLNAFTIFLNKLRVMHATAEIRTLAAWATT